MNAKKTWALNGYRYWSLQVEGTEVIASIPENYTPHFPPAHAKIELYSMKKGLAKFLGYLDGEQKARVHQAFRQAFAA